MRARKIAGLILSACLLTMPARGVQAAGTIIQVNATIDDTGLGTCTLRKAILAANSDQIVGGCQAGSGDDTIRVPVGVYQLNLSEAGEDIGLSGDLDVLASVTIEGAGRDLTIIEPSENESIDRILHIHAGASVSLQDVQIRRARLAAQPVVGDSRGGGIFNAGSLKLVRVRLNQNHAAGQGGGIYNSGALDISDSDFVENSAGEKAGAISNHGTLVLLRGYFSTNEADAAGAVENASGAQADITSTDFIENHAWRDAGAVDQAGQMTLRDSGFWINTSNEGAGALRSAGSLLVEDSLFDANDSSGGSAGILQVGGRLTIRRTSFKNNTGMQGGALQVENSEETRVENSQFLYNSAYQGAGINQGEGPITVIDSTFTGNSAYSGGAILVVSGTLNLRGSTLTQNGSNFEGGGAILVLGTAVIENSTISGNHAFDDGALAVFRGSAALNHVTLVNNEGLGIYISHGTVTLKSTILAGNTLESGDNPYQECGTPEEYTGQIISLGNNLVGTTSGCPWTSIQGDKTGSEQNLLDPRLGPLADNGGPTQTHALLADSPAIDAGGTSCPPVDQRGWPRPSGLACDIGAFERATALPVFEHGIFLPVIGR